MPAPSHSQPGLRFAFLRAKRPERPAIYGDLGNTQDGRSRQAFRSSAHHLAGEKASAPALSRRDKAARKAGLANRSRRPIGLPLISSLHVSEPSFMRSALPRDRREVVGTSCLRSGKGGGEEEFFSPLSFSFAPCSLPPRPVVVSRWLPGGALVS